MKNWRRRPGSSGVSSRDGHEEGSEDDTQELCEPSQQQAEVIAGSGENSVDCPSSDNLRLIGLFEKGGSGSSEVRVYAACS
ncbi:hypothetical protein [Bradyrhizobium japonicum]|uniref:hypothetical protein n=1 Tax=Bradyrhizobium japonicum TaxID=375 RepID=UPI002715386D|nr:hypothetical protein [Bradyrhizobium japonicum]WLB24562.1 hypothetical protein QIH95_51055 [Bradyrhizobium japonicum]